MFPLLLLGHPHSHHTRIVCDAQLLADLQSVVPIEHRAVLVELDRHLHGVGADALLERVAFGFVERAQQLVADPIT